MPILFSAVASNKVILNKFATCDGNFDEIVDEVVLKIPGCDHKMTYSHGRYLLNYISEDNCLYFCITDRTCQRSRAFLFLNEIKRQYKQTKCNFTSILSREMYRYNEDYGTIVIQSGELDELNSIGVDSSENLLGEKLLYVQNDQNLRYKTICCVEATPKTVKLSTRTTKHRFILIIVILVGLIAMVIFATPIHYAYLILFSFLYGLKR